MVVNQPAAQAVTGWSTYATLRSTDQGWTSADASEYVRNPYSFRVKVKGQPTAEGQGEVGVLMRERRP